MALDSERRFIELSKVRHVPVLVDETVELLALERGGLVVDCTVGLGGHAEALLEAGSDIRLLGIDRDPEAIALARDRLARFESRVDLQRGEFWDLEQILGAAGMTQVSGILADLGVSSLQIDEPERGFSFRFDGPLDMRMGPGERTAADIVNQDSEAELETIFREYGEERQARRVARAIAAARREEPLRTTEELKRVIYRAKRISGRRREGRVDAATRVFQALRIAVNRELSGLEKLLEQAVRLLEQDGRLVVISYHSLEDRIVKHTFRHLDRGEVDEITGRPLAETRVIEVLTSKPVRPAEEEVAANPRARSARLRAARRL